MKAKYLGICLVLVLAVCSASQAVDLLEDFESYADTGALTGVWVERNPGVVTLSLETTEAYDGSKSMVLDYNCHEAEMWSEAYNIFDANVDWSAYNTLNVWVKGYVGDVPGREPNQSAENMYIVVYTAKAEYPNPINNSQLEMLGKAKAYRATQIADWTLLRFSLTQCFEPTTEVRAIGIGMSPSSYGGGIVKIDAISLTEEHFGGVINNFEGYANTIELQNAPDVNEGNSTSSTLWLADDVNDANVLEGHKALKFQFNNGISPYWSKIRFALPRPISYVWAPLKILYEGQLYDHNPNGMNYNSLAINFKVIDPDGKIQVVLIGEDSTVKATYPYNNGARVPAGEWIRWDINPQSIYDLPGSSNDELDSVMRVEVQFVPIDSNGYGTGLVYLDDIHLSNCGDSKDNRHYKYPDPAYPEFFGMLRADFNGDCMVDFMDFAAFAEHWRQTGCDASNNYCGGADFLRGPSDPPVRDGKVDLNDLLIVTYRWLDCNMLFQGDCF